MHVSFTYSMNKIFITIFVLTDSYFGKIFQLTIKILDG
eukprot:UN18038